MILLQSADAQEGFPKLHLQSDVWRHMQETSIFYYSQV